MYYTSTTSCGAKISIRQYNMKAYILLIAKNWLDALSDKIFRNRLIAVILAIIAISFITNYFFCYNEDQKGGVALNDWVLNRLPAEDVSMAITFFMSSVILLFLIRTVTNPAKFITSLIAYVIILTLRIITIAFTHFQAPAELVVLHDPVSNLVYGTRFITRDLFFSGHVATIFLIYLSLYKRVDKYYLLFVVFSVGILLLVQHVHYTVDIVCAPIFALGGFWLSKRMTHLKYAGVHSRF